ncbi:hypothetical protein [Microcoleus sp.]
MKTRPSPPPKGGRKKEEGRRKKEEDLCSQHSEAVPWEGNLIY